MLRCFFVLPVLLGFQLFSEVALAVAVELGSIPVFAEDTGNIIPVRVVVHNRPPRADAGQQRSEEKNIYHRFFHDAKVQRNTDFYDCYEGNDLFNAQSAPQSAGPGQFY